MNRNEAFLQVLQSETLRQKAGISDANARSLKTRLAQGKVSTDKITEILLNAGMVIRREEQWGSGQKK